MSTELKNLFPLMDHLGSKEEFIDFLQSQFESDSAYYLLALYQDNCRSVTIYSMFHGEKHYVVVTYVDKYGTKQSQFDCPFDRIDLGEEYEEELYREVKGFIQPCDTVPDSEKREDFMGSLPLSSILKEEKFFVDSLVEAYKNKSSTRKVILFREINGIPVIIRLIPPGEPPYWTYQVRANGVVRFQCSITDDKDLRSSPTRDWMRTIYHYPKNLQEIRMKKLKDIMVSLDEFEEYVYSIITSRNESGILPEFFPIIDEYVNGTLVTVSVCDRGIGGYEVTARIGNEEFRMNSLTKSTHERGWCKRMYNLINELYNPSFQGEEKMKSNEVELSSFTQLDPLVPFSAYCEERVKSVLRYRFNFTYGGETIDKSHLIDIAVVPNEKGERAKVLVRCLDTFDGSVTSRTFHKDSEDMDVILAFFKESMYSKNTMFMYKVTRDVVNLFQEDFKETSTPLSYEVFCRLVDSCFPSIEGKGREKQIVHKYQPEGSKYSVILSIERPYVDITLIDNNGVYLVNNSIKEDLFKEYKPVNPYDVYTNVCDILTSKLEENQWKS